MNKAIENAFDLGISPHGLSANLPPPYQETRGLEDVSKRSTELESSDLAELGTAPHHPSASQQAKRAGGWCYVCHGSQAGGQQRRASARPAGTHSLELTECELLHAFYAVEQDRNQLRKAIRKGRAVEADLQGSQSLWVKLEAIMVARMMKSMGRIA